MILAILICLPLKLRTAPSTAPTNDAGHILCSYWRELPGTDIADLTSSPAYPGFPDEQVQLKQLEIPENQPPNFAAVIRGFVHPPADGNYVFYIAANNQGELWLSPDADPTHKTLIASVPEWSMPRDFTASPKQTSQPVTLKAGGVYYLEVRQKNGGGDNNLSVAWKLPDGTLQSPIPGTRLSAAAPVVVPPPKVTLGPLPASPGTHAITAEVNALARHFTVPMQITLPAGYSAKQTYPALLFLPDAPTRPSAGGEDEPPPENAAPAPPPVPQDPDHYPQASQSAGPLILISSRCPVGEYPRATTARNLAAVVTNLARHYPIDPRRIALTGSGAGGTEAWRVAGELPHFFAAIAPVNGHEFKEANLPAAVTGSRLRIYTDIADGAATEGANRMAANLASANPKPRVIFLGPKELGKTGTAAEHCYGDPGFYANLFAADVQVKTRTVAKAASIKRTLRRTWPLIALVVLMFALALYTRQAQKRAQSR